MDRRRLLAMGAAFAALAGRARAQEETSELRAAARDAWLYCLPLIEMAAARARMTGPEPTGQKAGVNQFAHTSHLAGPGSRTITSPNNDTLYSSAWLDLSSGPVTITLPPTGQRYFSLALMDMFTNNFAVFGTRANGGQGTEIVLAGPTGKAPPGAIRAPTTWVWALARTLVDGPEDLDAAHAVQDGIVLRARPGRIPQSGALRTSPWSDYFLWAQRLLADNPPPGGDKAFFDHIAPIQLGPTRGFEQARFADTELPEIEAGVADARALLMDFGRRQTVVDGWVYPKPDLGSFGSDYLYRAAVAVGGLAALPVEEAMYMRAVAPDGARTFSGGHYRLSLPPNLPIKGFWSLTMYEATPDGQFFLTPNALNRYAIGDRTPGLQRNAQGGVDIWIGREDPGPNRRSNWLPAPAQGPFSMTFRAYLPDQALFQGRFRLPALSPLDRPAPAIDAPPQPVPRAAPAPTPKRRRRRRRRG